MTRFIAEISSNHNGDKKRCLDLIRAAASCGCWGVKFQLFRIEHLFAPEILQVSETHRLRRRWELPLHFLPDLASCARDEGLVFGCTPFDLEAVDILQPHVDFLKVASYELPWLDLIQKCGETGLPLMMSCGMAEEIEVVQAVEKARMAGVEDLTVFHCISNYPVAPENCNLAAIGALQTLLDQKFPEGKVGWSDHSVNSGVVSRTVDHWNCQAVEFHFDLEGQGEEFAAGHCWLPQQIQPLVAGKKFESDPRCDGQASLKPTSSEQVERLWRADPSDGLRPTLPIRQSWPMQQVGKHAKSTALFLAGGPGLGHLVRLLAIAEKMRTDHGFQPIFSAPRSPGADKLLARHGFQRHPKDADILDLKPDVVVLDLKESCEEILKNFQASRIPTVAIDRPDCHDADLVIVPSFGWQPGANQAHHYGGTQYQLLRSDILGLRPRNAPVPGSRIVVSFGGEDPNLLTEKTALALTNLPDNTPVQFIIGPDFAKHRPSGSPTWALHPGFELIETNDPLETILPGAGLLVTAMGVTIAEAHVLGVPVTVLANYQTDEESVERLLQAGVACSLGFHENLSEEALTSALTDLWRNKKKRQKMAAGALEMTDGMGAQRAALLIAELLKTATPGEDGPC